LSDVVSFAFTEEQEDFRRALADFARKSLLPEYVRRSASTEFPWDAHRELAKTGLLGIGMPEEFGGTPDDPVMLGLAAETLAYGDVNVAAAPVNIGLIGAQLLHGVREVQEEYLPPLINGDITVAIALTEPGSGSDASGLRTVATPVQGGWTLRGEKTAITWAMNAQAALVYARDPGSERSHGVSCFLVPLSHEGVTASHTVGMGCLPLGWGSLYFDDVFVPENHLIGEQGRGFRAVMDHFDFSRSALGLLCLGAARASLDEAARYAQQRQTFGHPIADYQGVAFPLAEHETYMEAARALCFKALWARQEGLPHTALASMSKWWPPLVAKDAIEGAMRIHGNLGYSAEFPLQQRFRDVMAYLVADGTSEIQKRIIASDLFRRVGSA
jgi:cyclohexanecarboxyl-CoA dehydrogenase